jgi:hypothetical protein
MIIWFSSWNLYRLETNKYQRFENEHINHFKVDKSNALEIHCLDEDMIDFIINNKIDLSEFNYISIHSPNLQWDWVAEKILWKIRLLIKKINLKNIVIHPDRLEDFSIFKKFKDLPLSIENMDNDKSFWKSIHDIWPILDKYKSLWLTLDLQHCFVNDNSMKLADDFHDKYWDRIVEYHISWYGKKYSHYKLFKTQQDIIIDSLKLKEIPIIIESSLDEVGDIHKELDYIIERLK